jgi:hypothetical protein
MTKRERETLSKRRQTLYKRKADWDLTVKNLEYEAAVHPKPSTQDQLKFAKAERDKLRKELFKLEQGHLKQRAWNGGRKI